MNNANNERPTFNLEELLKQYVYPHLPDDEQFQQNFRMLVFDFLEMMDSAERSHAVKKKEIPNIEIYENLKVNLIKNHALGAKAEQVIEELNFQATMYLITTAAKNIGIQSKDLLKKLKKIEDRSKKLLEVIDSVTLEEQALMIGAFSFSDFIGMAAMLNTAKAEEVDPKEWIRGLFLSRANQFRKELIFTSEIRANFINSSAGQWLQLGSSGPKENSALSIWLTGLAEFWTKTLGRSLSYKDTQFSGRERFLTFAETCMEPLHAEILETDTIRNAFEKLRQNGKLDYLSEISP